MRQEDDGNFYWPVHGRSLMLGVLYLSLHDFSLSMIFENCQKISLLHIEKPESSPMVILRYHEV
jgi:hypothetical protein